MNERTRVLVELVKEVLGPREGVTELLPPDRTPRDEFITGILAPWTAEGTGDIEGEVEDIACGADSDEEIEHHSPVVAPGYLSPTLAPKELPRSIGISFRIAAEDRNFRIEICATWARYVPDPAGLRRTPRHFLKLVDAAVDDTWDAGDDVRIVLRRVRLDDGTLRVSVFLLNNRRPDDPERLVAHDHVNQPQIRIHCAAGTQLRPVRRVPDVRTDEAGAGAEERGLDLLYEHRAALARGHLVGVVWRAIDPERQDKTGESRPDSPPFVWLDADSVPVAERHKFSPADVRTDFVPCYPIEAPQFIWPTGAAGAPELSAAVLAETWNDDDLKARLLPLVDGYSAWIASQRTAAEGLEGVDRVVAQENLNTCTGISARLQQGIDLLVRDPEARLAFCFANKAIDMQSLWKCGRGEPLRWRPFQLAFILLCLRGIADPTSTDRQVCDLLWFPTGGGKTEAYLALAAFTLALRRRRRANTSDAGVGTSVISRYTLRLLTIQQFRRALGVITSAEYLRVDGMECPGALIGWRPREAPHEDTFLWGGDRFAAGLWVGGAVTPNALQSFDVRTTDNRIIRIVGAVETLRGARKNYNGPDAHLTKTLGRKELHFGGDPAQVINCPCCDALLTVPGDVGRSRKMGLGRGRHVLHFTHVANNPKCPTAAALSHSRVPITVESVAITDCTGLDYGGRARVISIAFTVDTDERFAAEDVDEWYYDVVRKEVGLNGLPLCARPSRPGYFITTYDNSLANRTRESDFEICCPNPRCDLNARMWAEQAPISRSADPLNRGQRVADATSFAATEVSGALAHKRGRQWQHVSIGIPKRVSEHVLSTIPIPAYTVDDQIYQRCPSLLVATVDKFARLSFEPKAGTLFGAVTHYHAMSGYYRDGAPHLRRSEQGVRRHPPGGPGGRPLHVEVQRLAPPDLILQDELHLIEGPLGSMVGLYETVVEELCRSEANGQAVVAKYIASTATIRNASSQVRALFDRNLSQFPPAAISADERFFATEQEPHPLDARRPGRLYVGICAPGKGAQTPIIRIWSSLLQSAWESHQVGGDGDGLWTLVGYFNAIRELAGAVALHRQDIPERMAFRWNQHARDLDPDGAVELSSRVDSLALPSILADLNAHAPASPDAVFATSMFGTGVDVPRLGLMVVHGQPKSTSSYIQATGRVGRLGGGLVVTFFRASRPRDLDHYEFFTGYHRSIYRFVEPVTVSPFAPRARDRAFGPMAVALLRQGVILRGHAVPWEWKVEQHIQQGWYSAARRMAERRTDPEVCVLPDILVKRASTQPPEIAPNLATVEREVTSELDKWRAVAKGAPNTDALVYREPTMLRSPQRAVVLGDPQHERQGLAEVYENAPQSLREVEETTTFKV